MLRPVALGVLLLASVVVSPASATGSEEQIWFVEREAERHATGVLDEGETRAFSFHVAEANLTRVDFLLTWSETGDPTGLSRPDAFSMDVTGPDARAGARGPDAGGRLHVRVPVTPPPAAESVPAGTAAARIAALATSAGTGEWVARVRLADVGNPVALAPVDAGNAFDLLVVLTTYEAVPARVVSQVGTASDGATPLDLWGLAAAGLALVVLGATVALLRPRALPPARDNTPSSTAAQRAATPPGDDSPYMGAHGHREP